MLVWNMLKYSIIKTEVHEKMQKLWKSKKGIEPVTAMIVAVVIAVALSLWIVGGMKSPFAAGTGVTVGEDGTPQQVIISQPEDVTVTFNSYDAYAKATDVSQGHRILNFAGDTNVQKNDDATGTYSGGDAYQVVLGNLTTSLTGGTHYYPVLAEGNLPRDKGTFIIGGGQYKTVATTDITYYWKNEKDQVDTAVGIGSAESQLASFCFKVADNKCFGNRAVDNMVNNAVCFKYNNTAFKAPDLIGESTVSIPNSVTATTGKRSVCYPMPTVCDNENYCKDVLLEAQTGINPGADSWNISISFHDGSFDYHADELTVIYGLQDESGNDIGISDLGTTEYTYQIGVS